VIGFWFIFYRAIFALIKKLIKKLFGVSTKIEYERELLEKEKELE
jgi:hypothetical protein